MAAMGFMEPERSRTKAISARGRSIGEQRWTEDPGLPTLVR